MKDTPDYYNIGLHGEDVTVSDVNDLYSHWARKVSYNALFNTRDDPSFYFKAGNIFKYLWRFPFKSDPLSDLKKLRDFIDELIDGLEEQYRGGDDEHVA